MKASEDAPEEARWLLTVPRLGGEPVRTYARSFFGTGVATVAVATLVAWFLTREAIRTVEVAAIAATLHALRLMIPQWAWIGVAAIGCGVMMWLVGGSVFLIIWAVGIVPIAWLVERQRRRSSREGM